LNTKVLAIIPAHNEQNQIGTVIEDLLNQSMPVPILVVLDNCTDGTKAVVKEYLKMYRQVYFYETVHNTKKKAGAINQILKVIWDYPLEALLIMDADTRIDKYAVEHAWKVLKSDDSLSAICSKAGVLPYQGKNIFKRMLYRLQRLEYSLFDSQRVETFLGIKVVHGMAALHRFSAIKSVGGYDDDNLVEDYDLTVRYKESGFKVTVDLNMKAYTEVPVSLKDWWVQRLRWNRGGLETLKSHGWNKVTRKDILQHYFMNIMTPFQYVFLIAFIVMLLQGYLLMHGLVLVLTLLGMVSGIYRLKYLEDRTVLDYILRFSLIPEMAYGLLQSFNQYHAYFKFLFNKKQSW